MIWSSASEMVVAWYRLVAAIVDKRLSKTTVISLEERLLFTAMLNSVIFFIPFPTFLHQHHFQMIYTLYPFIGKCWNVGAGAGAGAGADVGVGE